MSKLIGVVVLYNPNIKELSDNIKSYINDLDALICVDNSDYKTNLSEISNTNIWYYYMGENIGLARALEFGINKAIAMGADFIAQFDQDSLCDNNCMKKLMNIIVNDEQIGMVGPNINLIYRNKGKRIFSTQNKLYNSNLKEVAWLITSGSIIRADVYKQIGGIDTSLFISGIDRDVCCRVRATKNKIVLCGDCILFQEAGNTKKIKILGKVLHPPYLNYKRYYYIFRNELYLRRKNGKAYVDCKTNLFKYLICVLLFEGEKVKKIKQIGLGIYDSFKM